MHICTHVCAHYALSPPEEIPRHLIEQHVFYQIPHPTNDFCMFHTAHRSHKSVNSHAFCLLPYIPFAERPCWIQANTICDTATEPEPLKTDIKNTFGNEKNHNRISWFCFDLELYFYLRTMSELNKTRLLICDFFLLSGSLISESDCNKKMTRESRSCQNMTRRSACGLH